MIGQTLSHFRITAKPGEGGMGEVHRAEDATLAALDHPNIVTIHSVEEDDGVHFLTMQLVEGKLTRPRCLYQFLC